MGKLGNRWGMFGGPMDMVLPCLYLGGAAAEERYEELKERGITHVLQVGIELCPSHPDAFTYLTHACHDHPRVQLDGFFPRAFAFIDEGRAAGGVLVHCVMGASRSATICIGYIMWKQQRTRDEALRIVQAVRPTVQPNSGFMAQLLVFQERQWRLQSEDGDDTQAKQGTADAPQAASGALLPV